MSDPAPLTASKLFWMYEHQLPPAEQEKFIILLRNLGRDPFEAERSKPAPGTPRAKRGAAAELEQQRDQIAALTREIERLRALPRNRGRPKTRNERDGQIRYYRALGMSYRRIAEKLLADGWDNGSGQPIPEKTLRSVVSRFKT